MLPLGAALLPLLGTTIAFVLSVEQGLIPVCNPFVDGCVSISRAARHGLPNILFRAMVLPAAVLQAAVWWLCPAWLSSQQCSVTLKQRALPWLGLAAGVFLILYGTFLGTEGEGYRFMRRYGVVLYFGLTCIGMLIVSGEMHRISRDDRGHRSTASALLGVCLALPVLGLVHVLLPLALPTEAVRDALQNVTEWWAGVIFTTFFLVLAWAWRRSGFAAKLGGP